MRISIDAAKAFRDACIHC